MINLATKSPDETIRTTGASIEATAFIHATSDTQATLGQTRSVDLHHHLVTGSISHVA